tara:strand:- start:3396 stop:4196 length:801 start_codon:yes stop_codon:yes gene_type:complete
LPELPEVQTVVNSLAKLKNKKIILFESYYSKIIFNLDYSSFLENILNKRIINIYRRGKYILIKLNSGYLACHLRMTGQLFLSDDIPSNKTHMRAFFKLSKGFLIYNDIRKFGGFYYFDDIDDFNSKVGVDPYDKEFTPNWLKKGLSSRYRSIKHLLLDQKFICGLGNIYIDEILWLSRIHPKKKSNEIKNIQVFYDNILLILNNSIKYHGTTIINFSFDNMKTGDFKNELKVYGREHMLCYNGCNNKIIKEKIASRSTHYCKKCQK